LPKYLRKYYFSNASGLRKLHDEIAFTDECLKQIDIKKKSKPNQLLRIEVEGGVGCSGYRYNFKFDDQINSDDFVYEKGDNKYVLVDEITLGFLKGSKIDYEQVMIRAGFVVADNPNAEKSCGCKVSFSPKQGLMG